MLNVVYIVVAIWLLFSLCIAWFSSFNWLLRERVVSNPVSRTNYVLKYMATPIIVTTLVAEGATTKILNFLCKE